ncbi:MAG TPA: DUF4276 family protein [Chlorobaculum parvum]|uniref:DUF4276 family protein n=1 Tax=Chlorobaculum parvum TaxID=274539 RepID=A0A7C5DEW2_9CHLB|nr:DUF4276 family protein [Chlorobaculum parvum]
MTGKVVFLLEERSMKALLEGLLPRFLPNLQFQCVPHEGKQDLEKSIPRKLRAWQEPGVRFVIIYDNDGGNCIELKQRLTELCNESGRQDTLVRIACQELEAWYFGDPEALARAFDKKQLRNIGNKARYRDPDSIIYPSKELSKLIPEFQKISGARKMSAHLSRTENRSSSFHALINGLERLATSMSLSE